MQHGGHGARHQFGTGQVVLGERLVVLAIGGVEHAQSLVFDQDRYAEERRRRIALGMHGQRRIGRHVVDQQRDAGPQYQAHHRLVGSAMNCGSGREALLAAQSEERAVDLTQVERAALGVQSACSQREEGLKRLIQWTAGERGRRGRHRRIQHRTSSSGDACMQCDTRSRRTPRYMIPSTIPHYTARRLRSG